MSDIIFLVQESDYELIERIKGINCNVMELKDNNFDGDTTVLALLITITSTIVTQLGEIIKTMIQNPSKGKIKINGIEIEGFTYDETMNLIDKMILNNKENVEENNEE